MARQGLVRGTRIRIRNSDSAALHAEIVANPTANRTWTLSDRSDTFLGVTEMNDRLLLHIPIAAFTGALSGTDQIIGFTGTPTKNVGGMYAANNFTPPTSGHYDIILAALAANSGVDTVVYTSLYQAATLVTILSVNSAGTPPAGVSLDVCRTFFLTGGVSYNIKVATTGAANMIQSGLSIKFLSP